MQFIVHKNVVCEIKRYNALLMRLFAGFITLNYPFYFVFLLKKA